jgi:hypothetical protein
MECLRKLQKQNLDYKMIWIDDIGPNETIVQMMNGFLEKTTGAYYFINWMFPHKVMREKAFIMI